MPSPSPRAPSPGTSPTGRSPTPSRPSSHGSRPPPRARSTTCAGPPRTGGMPSRCLRAGSSPGSSTTGGPRADPDDGQRRRARGRRPAGNEPAHAPSRRARAHRLEERVRAGRVRLVLGLARRRARVLVPRPRRAGGRRRRADRRGARRQRRPASRAGSLPRRRRRPVRLLHAGARRRGCRPARARAASQRGRDSRGARRESLPLHRLPEDRRRRPARRGGARVSVTKPRGGIGESARRVEGEPKVTGAYAYGSDLATENMLWAVTVRSPHASARIRSIDTAAARRMDGVRCVLTGADLEHAKTFGLEFCDQPVLAEDVVRYVGEAVAVVAAETLEEARLAAAAITVDYEPLPAVTDMERALDADAPLVHDFGNVLRHVHIVHADPEHAAAEVW